MPERNLETRTQRRQRERREAKETENEAAERRHKELGFNPAWWFGAGLALVLAILAVIIPIMQNFPLLTPWFVIVCFLAATVFAFIGTLQVVTAHLNFQWPIKASYQVNLLAAFVVVAAVGAIYFVHPLSIARVILTTSIYHSRPALVQPHLTAQDRLHMTLGMTEMGDMYWLENGASLGGISLAGC